MLFTGARQNVMEILSNEQDRAQPRSEPFVGRASPWACAGPLKTTKPRKAQKRPQSPKAPDTQDSEISYTPIRQSRTDERLRQRDQKSTRLNSRQQCEPRMPFSPSKKQKNTHDTH